MEALGFTRRLSECLDDEAYRTLQIALIRNPEQGRIIRGSGGLRKLRWGSASGGKRGGVRIIYYWQPRQSTLFCLYVYRKNVQGDLIPAQVRGLRTLVEEEFG
jgi:mRNA-degrading endonuclease RelE of RelBE toxin-antitoxin system